MCHLCHDFQFGACRLGVAHHGNFLELLARLASALERDRHIAFPARGDPLLGVVGHCAATCGAAALDNQIRISGVAEMKAVADILACRQTTEIMCVVIESEHRHFGARVIS